MPGRPFPKGASGNPGGRPKESAIVAKLIMDATDDGKLLVDQLLTVAKHGEARDRVAASRVLLEYALGKPRQQIEVQGGLTLGMILDRLGAQEKPKG